MNAKRSATGLVLVFMVVAIAAFVIWWTVFVAPGLSLRDTYLFIWDYVMYN